MLDNVCYLEAARAGYPLLPRRQHMLAKAYLPGRLHLLDNVLLSVRLQGLANGFLYLEGCTGWPVVLPPGRPGWLMVLFTGKAARAGQWFCYLEGPAC